MNQNKNKYKIINVIGYLINILENNCNLNKLFISKNKIRTNKLLNSLNYPTTEIIPRKKIKYNQYIVCNPIYGKFVYEIHFSKPNHKIPNDILNNKNYMFEKFVEGRNYRIIFYKNSIITAYERITPKVIGDGVKTIQELVNISNKTRENINQILLDKNLNNPNNIPKKNEFVECTKLCHYINGGSINYLNSNSIPQKTINLLTQLSKDINLNIFAIDLISSNIEEEIRNQKIFCINELEYCNDWSIHYFLSDEFSILCTFLLLKWFLIAYVIIFTSIFFKYKF